MSSPKAGNQFYSYPCPQQPAPCPACNRCTGARWWINACLFLQRKAPISKLFCLHCKTLGVYVFSFWICLCPFFGGALSCEVHLDQKNKTDTKVTTKFSHCFVRRGRILQTGPCSLFPFCWKHSEFLDREHQVILSQLLANQPRYLTSSLPLPHCYLCREAETFTFTFHR